MKRLSVRRSLPVLATLLFAALTPTFAAPPAAAPSGSYLKSYNLRFTTALRASGLSVGAHSISSRPDSEGRLHQNVELRSAETAGDLALTYAGGPNSLQLLSAQLDEQAIAPSSAAAWAQLDFWHVAASRSAGLKPTAVSLVSSGLNGLRTADLLIVPVADPAQDLATSEVMLHDGSLYSAGSTPLMALGPCSEATFRQLAAHPAFGSTGPAFQAALGELGLAPAHSIFSDAPQPVAVGRLFAVRDALPYRTRTQRVSALLWVQATPTDGTVDLLVARAPVDLDEVNWMPAARLVP